MIAKLVGWLAGKWLQVGKWLNEYVWKESNRMWLRIETGKLKETENLGINEIKCK